MWVLSVDFVGMSFWQTEHSNVAVVLDRGVIGDMGGAAADNMTLLGATVAADDDDDDDDTI